MTLADRHKIEALLSAGQKPCAIARILHFHHATIYREIKRGLYTTRDYEYREVKRYSSDIAHAKARENLKAKGGALKIGNDLAYANYIENKIANEGYSPAAVLGELKATGEEKKFKTKICVTTLYNYIDKGIFLTITNKDLPIKKDKKRVYHHIKRAKSAPKGTSIEKRPKSIDSRKEFGHWEMDTVVGKAKGKNKPALLVLTERKTRREIVYKLENHTKAAVVSTINRLEKKWGSKFKDVFKSITVDNGSEFNDTAGIEQSILYDGKRTDLYYCHPYSSYERGTNENTNRLIRRHIPKSTDITHSEAEIQKIEDWINNYPRQIHGYKTAADMFNIELLALT